MEDVAELAAEYRRLTVEWAGMPSSKHAAANRLFDARHQVQKSLAATEAGRAALTQLMEDDNPDVRGAAAAHSLRWAEARARVVLTELRDHEPPLRGSLSAKYVLREHDAGRLTFDY